MISLCLISQAQTFKQLSRIQSQQPLHFKCLGWKGCCLPHLEQHSLLNLITLEVFYRQHVSITVVNLLTTWSIITITIGLNLLSQLPPNPLKSLSESLAHSPTLPVLTLSFHSSAQLQDFPCSLPFWRHNHCNTIV